MLLRASTATGSILLALAASCSAASTATEPNVAGTYVMTVVDGTNACDIAGVSLGTATAAVPLTVAQQTGALQNMTVTVGGATGATLKAVIGTDVFTGTLGGTQAALLPTTLDGGTPMGSSGTCMFTPAVVLNLTFTGSTVQGSLVYTLAITGGSCGTLTGCQTVQVIAGVLPPTTDLDASRRNDG